MPGDAQLLKGILEGCILALLQRQKNYGYRVVEELRDSGLNDSHEGTVYPILTRLHKNKSSAASVCSGVRVPEQQL